MNSSSRAQTSKTADAEIKAEIKEKIKADFIEKTAAIMQKFGLTEITLENEGVSLYIKAPCVCAKGSGTQETAKAEADARGSQGAQGAQGAQKSEHASSINDAAENNSMQDVSFNDAKKPAPVISNMIGLFFDRPKPDAAPFVKIGDRVEKGQQLCIIETIKLMNNIYSEVSGTVKEICLENSRPVEYGQTIMYIEQD